jgi:hypothetical protein
VQHRDHGPTPEQGAVQNEAEDGQSSKPLGPSYGDDGREQPSEPNDEQRVDCLVDPCAGGERSRLSATNSGRY